MEFAEAVGTASAASVRRFQAWCQERGIDYADLDEADIDKLLEKILNQTRKRSDAQIGQ